MRLNIKGNFIYLIAFIMIVSFSLLAIFVIYREFNHIEQTFEDDILHIARIISADDNIENKLEADELTLHLELDQYMDNLSEGYELIVIDDQKIVYYSPWWDHETSGDLGFTLNFDEGYNDVRVLTENEEIVDDYYVSGSRTNLRAYVPVVKDDIMVGKVIVQVSKFTIRDVKIEKLHNTVLAFGLGLIASLLSLIGLKRWYKSELFGIAPSKIGLLYAENNSIIEQINEGIISIDANYNVSRVNKTLLQMFELKNDIIGKQVTEVFPYIDFTEIINKKKHIENKYKKINNEKYLMNSFPLYHENKIIGATAIFRIHLEVDSLIDQISGYQSIAKALRSQKHEFQNKLHVVLGLIKMKDYEKAENYIMENVYTTNLASDYYTSRIKDDRVLALFVGKEIQSKEFNVDLLLTSDSYITKSHNPINSDDIVLVLGNLIDNSFEAYKNSDSEDKKVVVDMFEDEEQVKLTVIDQAGGIDDRVLKKMFERGVSTKQGDSRGTGLSLVSEIITVYSGEKHVESSTEETKIEIILMKVIS